ncbi:MAG TPA: C4-type zinc ribbon domain-containing protein [Dehalococcoidia bacterium]|nr:C4-type zinc ribbon domain-containing protein [Dehalococcoidia bacterium]
MTQFSDLSKLQEIDSALDARRGSLDDARSRMSETEELIAARARVDELRSELRIAQSAQRDIEIEADDLKAKIAPQEAKLYSGAIKNPKELAGLQADIDQLKRHLSSVEDRDLAALAALETAEGAERAAVAELAALEAAWREEQEELSRRVAQLTAEIAAYELQRDEVSAGIDGGLLTTYDRLRKAHQGRGVARLDRNLCLGCRISLPTAIVNRARAGSTLVQCPNCERILIT